MQTSLSGDEPIGQTLCHFLPDLQHLAWLAAAEEKEYVVFCVQSQADWQRKLPVLSLFTALDTSDVDLRHISKEYVVGVARREICKLAAQMSKEIADPLLTPPSEGTVRVLLFYHEAGPRILSVEVVPEKRLLC